MSSSSAWSCKLICSQSTTPGEPATPGGPLQLENLFNLNVYLVKKT